jgi:peptide/nickel transport system substrate-binding protein
MQYVRYRLAPFAHCPVSRQESTISPRQAIAILTFVMLSMSLECRRHAQTQGQRTPPNDLVIAVEAEPKEGFDPLLGWGRYGSPLFQSTLLKRDAQQHLVPDLAEGAELSEDRLTWRIRIRGDARFHDGNPVTVDDVAFTFNQAARAQGKTDVTALREAVVTGPNTLEFHLKKPQITFVNRLVTLGIVPAHNYGPDYSRHPIGSGPYRLVRWDEGRQMIMEANPHYYGGKPRIMRVVFLYLEEDAAFAAARAGTAHVIHIPAALASRKLPGMRVVSVPSVDNRGISFPSVPHQATPGPGGVEIGNDVTSNLALRKAINVAVDRKALVNGVLEGYGSPSFGPVSHLPWNQPDGAIVDGDAKAARDILTKDGWRDVDGDGILEKDGHKAEFTLLYPADDLTRQGLAMAVSDMLRPIGIQAVVTARSWDTIYKLMHAHPVVFGFGSLDQTEMHSLFHSSPEAEAVYNAGHYRNPTVDAYLDQALSAPSEAAAIELWRKAQWDGETGFAPRGDAPWAWLVNLDHVYLVDERLDVGLPAVEQHGTTIAAGIPSWRWKGAP